MLARSRLCMRSEGMYKWSSAENLSSSTISTLSSELSSCLRPPTGCPYYVYSTKNRARRPSTKARRRGVDQNLPQPHRPPPHSCRSASSSTSVTRVAAAALRKPDTNSHRPAYRVVISKHAVDERVNGVQMVIRRAQRRQECSPAIRYPSPGGGVKLNTSPK